MNSNSIIKNGQGRWALHLLVLLVMYSASFAANALRWPTVADLRITECRFLPGSQGQYTGYTCNYFVYFAFNSVIMAEAPDNAPPAPSTIRTTEVQLWGIHCSRGDATSGVPYSQCLWDSGLSHTPRATNCHTTTNTGWELTPTSTCTPVQTNYGAHAGAGAGGECLMYGKYALPGILYTPYGPMDPEVVANSMHHLCVKPLPPAVTCEVMPLDGLEFDHGIMTAGSVDTRSLAFNIDCGGNPSVITASGRLHLADGVVSVLSANILSDTNMVVTSQLTTSAAAQPGAYSGTDIIIVSPQ